MRLAKQGWRFVAVGLGFVFLGALTAVHARRPVLGMVVGALGGAFTLFCAYFFRDPERPLPLDPTKIYSPGDGKVLSVSREGPGDVVTLRIFLSVFDVHIQRAPCAGSVEKVHCQPGSFRAAMLEAARGNERCVMTLNPEGKSGPVMVEQIAGLLARRIECRPKAGDRLKAGERYGIIYFGSQAAVHFPAGARCTVKPGDRVVGGVTAVGEWTG